MKLKKKKESIHVFQTMYVMTSLFLVALEALKSRSEVVHMHFTTSIHSSSIKLIMNDCNFVLNKYIIFFSRTVCIMLVVEILMT
jgi:hypothetical protein